MASATEFVVLAAALALFAMHALGMVCNALASEWRAEARKAFSKAVQYLARLCKRHEPDDLSKEVAAMVRVRQLRRFRSILTGLKWYYCIGTAVHIKHLGTRSFASLEQDIMVMTGYAIALLADRCPGLVTENSMGVWYSCIMVLWNLYIIPPWCAYDVMLNWSVFIRMAIAFVNLGCLRIKIVIVWSVVRMICSAWAVTHEHGISSEGFYELKYEFVFMIGMILLVGVFARFMELDCRRDAEAQATEEKHDAVNSLLSMTYDVVVELDHDFRIANPSPALSSFLLRPSPAALQHVPFENLTFEEADRELFLAQVCGALETASSKVMIQLRLVDGHGNAIPVEIFCFRCHTLGRRPHCLLGVREYADHMQHHTRADEGGEPVPGVDQVCELEEVVAVVDVMNNQLKILDCSPAFRVKLMPMTKNSCFLPALTQGGNFVDWLQTIAQRQWYSGEDEGDSEDVERPRESILLTFKPHGRGYTRALCSAVLCRGSSSSDDTGMPSEIRMRLTFSHLMKMPLHQLGDSIGSTSDSSGGSSSSGPSSRNSSHRRGTPRASLRSSLPDQTPHGVQALVPEAAGTTTYGRPLCL